MPQQEKIERAKRRRRYDSNRPGCRHWMSRPASKRSRPEGLRKLQQPAFRTAKNKTSLKTASQDWAPNAFPLFKPIPQNTRGPRSQQLESNRKTNLDE